ncbi:MAG: succinate dehydrogenase assembly factor 2 [Burkholderiaceae bacterium]|nr:succinate dehydrogenase assembly factor 2 [Burkholderiaceae bacterium]
MTPASALDARPSTLDDLALRRLRWRARRGLLENDLIIERFLAAHGSRMTSTDLDAFARLLELPDNELLDLLLARKEPAADVDSSCVRALLGRLRAC